MCNMVEFDFGIIKRAKIGTAAGVEFYARVEGTTARGIKISLAHGAPFYISLDRARSSKASLRQLVSTRE